MKKNEAWLRLALLALLSGVACSAADEPTESEVGPASAERTVRAETAGEVEGEVLASVAPRAPSQQFAPPGRGEPQCDVEQCRCQLPSGCYWLNCEHEGPNEWQLGYATAGVPVLGAAENWLEALEAEEPGRFSGTWCRASDAGTIQGGVFRNPRKQLFFIRGEYRGSAPGGPWERAEVAAESSNCQAFSLRGRPEEGGSTASGELRGTLVEIDCPR